MKRFALLLLTLIMVFSFTSLALADPLAKCQGCHNGTLAPKMDQLKEKYEDAAKFIEAAKKTENGMMTSIKQDEEGLKAAAESLYK